MLPKKNGLVLFVAIFLIVALLHGRAYDAGFVTDFTGLWAKMQGKNILDAFQSFGFPSLMPLLNVFYFLFYEIFGLSGLPWFLFFCSIYSTGVLFFYKSSLELLSEDSKFMIALSAVVLILVSPYQVEALIWKVGLGHLSSVCFFMIALYYGLRFLKEGSRSQLIIMVIGQVCSLLCFEWAIVYPLVLCILGIYLISDKVLKAVIVATITVVTYLVLTKIMIGKAIGHYDVTASQILDLPTIVGTAYKYLTKHFLLVHFLDYNLKDTIYKFGQNPVIVVLIVALGILAVYKLYKVKSSSSRLSWALLLCCFCSMLLVLPLFFQYTLLSENDRYGSLLVPFLSLLVVLFLSRVPRLMAGIVFVMYLLVNLYFQQKLVTQWQQSQKVVVAIEESWPDKLVGNTLLLNLPDNYNGVFMFRDFSSENALVDHMNVRAVTINDCDLVGQYNIAVGGQNFVTKWEQKEKVLSLSCEEWGSWWWKKGIGATDYKNERYSVDFQSKRLEVTLFDRAYYNQILYFDGKEWKFVE